MMNQISGWIGGTSGAMWAWAVIGIVVAVQLLIAISRLSQK